MYFKINKDIYTIFAYKNNSMETNNTKTNLTTTYGSGESCTNSNSDNGNNIVEVIQSRLEFMGMSQAQFASSVLATPAQMGIFLRQKGTLSLDSLNKSLSLVGIKLSLYSNRNILAKEVASYLLSKNVSSIDNWSKQDLSLFTHQKSIAYFFDVETKEELVEMECSGIVDVESTFPYFKALVSYYMSLGAKKPTASKAKQTLSSMFNNSTAETLSLVFQRFKKTAVDTATSVTDFVSNVIDSDSATKQVGAFTLFSRTSASSLFAKALEYLKSESKH